ncbi:MAG TPA: tetratricopeptide repeat protein, partial [Kofleriaceae bacterium]
MAKIAYRLALIASLVAGVAHADGKLDDAKAHLQNGAALYDENNFRGALVEFQKAYDLAPSYKILFNIGQVEMELQDYAGALKAYTRYLKEGGPDVPPDRGAQVNAEIERMKGRVGFLLVQTTAGAQVLVDDAQVGYAPLPDPVPVAAGQHRVTVTIAGRDPVNRVFDIAGKETVTAALAIEPAPSDKPSTTLVVTPTDTGPKSKTPVYAMWSVTGAFVIGAGVFAVIAHGDSNDLTNLRNAYPVTAGQLDSQRSKTVRDAAITDVLTGAAVVSAGIAAYLTLTRMGHDNSKEKAITLNVAPTGFAVMG